MKTLTEQIEEIKSAVADVGCKAVHGKTCEELVAEIIDKAMQTKRFPFDFSKKFCYNVYVR